MSFRDLPPNQGLASRETVDQTPFPYDITLRNLGTGSGRFSAHFHEGDPADEYDLEPGGIFEFNISKPATVINEGSTTIRLSWP